MPVANACLCGGGDGLNRGELPFRFDFEIAKLLGK